MYYWRIYVEGTGEILERGSYPSVKRAGHDARGFIEKSLWHEDSDETYRIEVREGLRSYDTRFDMEDGPVVDEFPYRRYKRRSK